MDLTITISKTGFLHKVSQWLFNRAMTAVTFTAVALSVASIALGYVNDWIVRYGDSESHLNIAKRVVDSVTPGFAQLGGIWLPMPHVLMLPFVWSDFLWRTGLAGAIVSGLAYVISSVFIYKTAMLLMKNKPASLVAALVFMLNPNILYMQATPMTEMLLICFFVLSSYYFIKFLLGERQMTNLLIAAFFGFCAVLTRYDGWFLVCLEALCIALYFIPWRQLSLRLLPQYFRSHDWKKLEGHLFIYSTLAFFGILLWLAWGQLILGDPLYFTNSEFSAESQQKVWLAQGQLPAYHNIGMSLLYYFVTAMSNAGMLVFFSAILGFVYFLTGHKSKERWIIGLLLVGPFIFNVLTLFIGQSVIFIPHLTPYTYDHTLFNVRYGLMVMPLVALAFGYLFYVGQARTKLILAGLFLFQFALYGVGYSQVISYQDGMTGLSAASRPEAERWLNSNYDFGLVLMDDFARTVSIVRSGVPMEQMIYIGNKPYWEESLVTPDKHAEWIVMQENDAVWNSLWTIPARKSRLDKYYDQVYKSEIAPNIRIFKKKALTEYGSGELRANRTFWNFQCLDTMKYSRDASRALINRPDLDAFLENEMTLIQESGATCVSLGTPYDEEFVPILTAWVNKAREKNLNVWFRGNMSGWEGWFDYPRFTNPDDHNRGTYDLITKHPELFQEGDIFTPIPEPENGMLGDPRGSQENRRRFLEFLPKSYENCVNAFKEIEINVTCGYYSVNGDVAREVFTKDFLVKIGDVAVIDHYVSTPERLVEDIKRLNKQLDTQVVLGEFGAPIPDIHGEMTEAQQADFVDRTLAALYAEQDTVLGLNYWTFRGGSTTLVNDGGGTRQAYAALQKYFLPANVEGRVMDEFGDPLEGVTVKVHGQEVEAKTNAAGEYALAVPANQTKLVLFSPGWVGESEATVSPTSGQVTTQDFRLEPADKSLWYKIRLWLAR